MSWSSRSRPHHKGLECHAEICELYSVGGSGTLLNVSVIEAENTLVVAKS